MGKRLLDVSGSRIESSRVVYAFYDVSPRNP